jgi:hypothetical protein
MAGRQPGVLKGTELKGKITYVPGAEYGPAPPNLGKGGGSGTVVVPIPAAVPTDVLAFRPNVGDEAVNVSGAGASLVELSTYNPAFFGKGWLLPGAANDVNTINWVNFPIPSNLKAIPSLRLRLHFIIPVS